MKDLKQFTILFLLIIYPLFMNAQKKESLATQLGYPENAKLLIIHADDLGLCHAENVASIKALEKEGINSGSIMIPCPWFSEFAEYAKTNPGLDIGVHLTLTSEWKHYRWGGVLPSSEITSLLDKDGYFYSSVEELAKYADPAEVAMEIGAQIDRAKAFGIKPTHLDPHMGCMAATTDIFKEYIKAGKKYELPIVIPLNYERITLEMIELLEPDYITVDRFYMIVPDTLQTSWFDRYKNMIEDIKPGLNELIVHPAIDNEEMKAITTGHPDYGSVWRQKDYDTMVDDEFKKLIKKNNIFLITWKEIRDLIY